VVFRVCVFGWVGGGGGCVGGLFGVGFWGGAAHSLCGVPDRLCPEGKLLAEMCVFPPRPVLFLWSSHRPGNLKKVQTLVEDVSMLLIVILSASIRGKA